MGASLNKTYDVCIVGSGLTGSAAARWASRQEGLKICLVGLNEPTENEWNDPSRTIFGSHYDQGRLVSEISLYGYHPSWSTLARRSISRFRDLETESGIRFFTEVGCLVKSTEDIIDEFWAKVPQKHFAEYFPTNELSPSLPCLQPFDDKTSAIFDRSKAGYMNPRKYIAANKIVAAKYGCEFVCDSVCEIKECRTELSRQYMKVKTKSGRKLRAQRVLLCAGAFTNYENLLPMGMEVDFVSETDTVALLEVAEEDVASLSNMPCGDVFYEKDEDPRNNYFLPAIQYPDGKYYVKVGQDRDLSRPLDTYDDVISWYKRRDNVPEESLISLMSRLYQTVKEFQPKSVSGSTCVCTYTPSGRFYCDMATPTLGVIVGGNGIGAGAADEIGRMGASMIAKGSWDHDLPAELFKLRYRA